MKIEEYAKNALINYGAALESWKIKILNINADSGDWVDVTCTLTKPRCRKPFMQWELKINMAKNITDFLQSTFTYL